jgi:hypothetical protein
MDLSSPLPNAISDHSTLHPVIRVRDGESLAFDLFGPYVIQCDLEKLEAGSKFKNTAITGTTSRKNMGCSLKAHVNYVLVLPQT